MLVPRVTLQAEVGVTRNFVVRGKFIRFRAQVPRIVSREMERRVRKLKKADGTPLFKVNEVLVAEPRERVTERDPVVKNKVKPVNMQHVDGDKNTEWKQRKFLK